MACTSNMSLNHRSAPFAVSYLCFLQPLMVSSSSPRVVKHWLFMSRRMAQSGAAGINPKRTVPRPSRWLMVSMTFISRSLPGRGGGAKRSGVTSPLAQVHQQDCALRVRLPWPIDALQSLQGAA